MDEQTAAQLAELRALRDAYERGDVSERGYSLALWAWFQRTTPDALSAGLALIRARKL